MAKSSTSFTESRQPPPEKKTRGKSKRTIILDAIKSASLMEAKPKMDNDKVEGLFFKHIAKHATDPSSEHFAMCLRLLADKGWSNIKPAMDLVSFDFDIKGTPAEQASQVIDAVSDGVLPPDVASTLVSIIASAVKIDEVTELSAKIANLEKMLGIEK